MKIDRLIKKLLGRTRSESAIHDIDYEGMLCLLKQTSNVILLDVRSPQEFRENRINGAMNIPWYDISSRICSIVPNKENIIVVYCQSGERSKKSCKVLEKMGYINLYNLKGGLDNI